MSKATRRLLELLGILFLIFPVAFAYMMFRYIQANPHKITVDFSNEQLFVIFILAALMIEGVIIAISSTIYFLFDMKNWKPKPRMTVWK